MRVGMGYDVHKLVEERTVRSGSTWRHRKTFS